MPPCRHSAVLFLTSHEVLNANMCTPFVRLPFRPDTNCRLEVAKVRNWATSVQIAIAGNAPGLRGALWFEDVFGNRTEERSFELNVERQICVPYNSRRIGCAVWSDDCALCFEERSGASGAVGGRAVVSQIPLLMTAAPQYPVQQTTEWHQPFSPKHSQKPSSAHIRKVEEELKRMRDQKETLKSEVAVFNAAVTALRRKCEEREKDAAREKARNDELLRERALLQKEVDELKSKLHEQESRSSSLQAEFQRRATAQKKAEQRAAHARRWKTKAFAAKKRCEFLEQQNAALLAVKREPNEAERPSGREAPVVPAAFSTMRSSGFLCDFRLLVDGRELRAHRNVLALRSALFARKFLAYPSESELQVDGISFEIVKRMLEFVYRGRLDGLEAEAAADCRELYAAARRFGISDLVEECTQVLKAGSTAENAADLLVLAVRNDDHELAAFVLGFAEANGGKVRLLLAPPLMWLVRNEVETYEKIVELME